jgi:hypothetical protein
MPKKATAQDAEIILRLYDLRREATMRVARKFVITEFWPQSYEEFRDILLDYRHEKNAFMRQVLTYWDMAAAMVLQGAVSEELFYASNVEPYFIFAKFGHHLEQLRKDYISPEFLKNVEALAKRPRGRERVRHLRERVAARQAQISAAKAAGKA